MVLPLLFQNKLDFQTLERHRMSSAETCCVSHLLLFYVGVLGHFQWVGTSSSVRLTWFRECQQSLSLTVPLKNWHSFLLLSLIISCQTTWRFHKQLNQLKRGCESLTSVRQTQMVWGRKDVVWRWNYKKMGNPKTWDYIYTWLYIPALLKMCI